MKNERLIQIEKEILKIKRELPAIGEMRPGSLTLQWRVPKKRIGPWYQLSYTHRMKSRTDYVRPRFVFRIRKQVANYRRLRRLVERWVELAIEHSRLKIKHAVNGRKL